VTLEATQRNNLIGASCAVAAALAFSFNDIIVKFLSGDYALHQVVLIRAILGMLFLLVFVVPFEGGLSVFRTQRLTIHLLRGLCVVFANMMFFLGLAAMKLADAVAIFFISPVVITLFSVLFLGEKVGPRRWIAVIIGLIGVAVMMRPGLGTFQYAALLPLAAAIAYAALHIFTRKIGGTERAATMAVYIHVVFILVSAGMGLAVGDGRFAGGGDPSLEFLLREWIWPDKGDFAVFLMIGAASAFSGYLISQAYRLAEAGLAAPFEYVAMPVSVLGGILVFGEWPDLVSWIGMALIISGGLYTFWRETIQNSQLARSHTRRR